MADNNRSINICLINSIKPTEGLPDRNRIGIDHLKSYIWFESRKDRDDYFALKTVYSQVQNSKIHDFNAVETFRINLDMESYYKLEVDLIKINHTQNGIENVYIYNITDVNYTNNQVVQLSVTLNPIYTYLIDDVSEKNQMQGVMSKTNFKNENVDVAYINDIAQKLTGDNYDLQAFSSTERVIINGEYESPVAFLTISFRKKPTVFDDIMNENTLIGSVKQAFSNEIVYSIPFNVTTGYTFSVNGKGTSEHYIGYIANLLLNGSLKVDAKKGFIGSAASAYQSLTDLPFTIASFYDIQEISVIPDNPYQWRLSGKDIAFTDKKEEMITLKDNMDEKTVDVYFVSYSTANKNIDIQYHHILNNDEKTKLFKNFENIENNIIYNQYKIKYFNLLAQISAYNLFGSKENLDIATYYLGKDFKKVIISTDETNRTNEINFLTGRNNTEYGIKFNGTIEDGSNAGSIANDIILKSLDLIGGVVGGAVGGLVGGGAGANVGAVVTGTALNTITSPLKNFQETGGSSGYNSSENNSSGWIGDFEEYIPKVICEVNANQTVIDQLTNYYGTSCNFFTNNLRDYIKETIKNRSNHKCVVQGNFRANYLYPQANEMLDNLLSAGIVFYEKMELHQELRKEDE